MLLEKDTHVITDKHLLSNDSGFSDEPSIPGDSFQKQSVNYIPTHNMKTGGPGRSVSPFNKFQITNMQQRYVESEKLLNKMPQKHEMNYPNQILA